MNLPTHTSLDNEPIMDATTSDAVITPEPAVEPTPTVSADAVPAKVDAIAPPRPPVRYIPSTEIEAVLLDAFGVRTVSQIMLRFADHIPHAPVVMPLMRVAGGEWAALLRDVEAFTEEQRRAKAGAGAGIALAKEAAKAVGAAP